MTFKLRGYQNKAANQIHNDLINEKYVLLSAIMGAGKTVITSRLINYYYGLEHSRRFLILAHKKELVEQFEKTFHEKTDIPSWDIGGCCSGLDRIELDNRVVIGTIQTFINQIDNYNECNLVVIDECHRIDMSYDSQYSQIINMLEDRKNTLRILGVTATPFRLGLGYIYGKKNKGGVLFKRLNYQISYQELKEQGYLVPLHGEVAINQEYKSDISNIRITSGDYQLDQASDVMTKSVHLQTAVKAIREKCQDYKHICVFCCSIQHAEMLKDLLNDEGEACTTIHSGLSPLEKEINMTAWKTGKIRIMTSVNILTEGFDFPPLDCIVFARPTKSPVLFLQAVGRALRISDGKESAFLLDLTDNTIRFGTDLDNIQIDIPNSVQRDLDKEKKYTKKCPECKTEIHPACIICPECEYEFPKTVYQDTKNPETKSVTFEPEPEPEPEWAEVYSISCHRHQKKDSPDSLRIDYHGKTGLWPICSDWLPFDNPKAIFFANKKWKKLAGTDLPKSTDDALERKHEIQKPDRILIGQDGKFKRILNYWFDEDTDIENDPNFPDQHTLY